MIRKALLAAVLIGATAAAGAATPSSGPTLSLGKGTVMINNGIQFVTAKPGQALKAGDRIMVMEGGSATLNYSNGCKSSLGSSSLNSVSAACSQAPLVQSKSKLIGPMYAQAVGDKSDSKACKNNAGKPVKCYGLAPGSVVGESELGMDSLGTLGLVAGGFTIITVAVLNGLNADGISTP